MAAVTGWGTDTVGVGASVTGSGGATVTGAPEPLVGGGGAKGVGWKSIWAWEKQTRKAAAKAKCR